jgi:hypothetical protein
MKKIGILLICLFVLAGCGTNKNNKSTPSESKDANNSSATHSSQGNANGPFGHSVYRATSTDGLNWKTDEIKLFDHASVPGAVILDGIIYLYFVDASGDEDQLSVATSRDGGLTFGDGQQVEIDGMPSYDAVDPNPSVHDAKIRLYFLGDFFSRMQNKGANQTFTMYYAETDDGITFGQPHAIYQKNSLMTDPDVFVTNNDTRMLVTSNNSLELAISTDDGVSFAKQTSFQSGGGVSSTFRFGDTYRTYYCSDGISAAIGVDQGVFNPEKKAVLGNTPGCDPSVIQLPDNTYAMFYKVQAMSNNQPNNPNPPTNPGNNPPVPIITTPSQPQNPTNPTPNNPAPQN